MQYCRYINDFSGFEFYALTEGETDFLPTLTKINFHSFKLSIFFMML